MAISLAAAAVLAAEWLPKAEAIGTVGMDVWDRVTDTIADLKAMALEGRTELTDEEWAEKKGAAHSALNDLRETAGLPPLDDDGNEPTDDPPAGDGSET